MRLKVEFVDLLLIGVVIHGRDANEKFQIALGSTPLILMDSTSLPDLIPDSTCLYVVLRRAVSLALLHGVRAQTVRAAVGKANALDVGECERIRRAEMLFHFRIDYVRIELVCVPHIVIISSISAGTLLTYTYSIACSLLHDLSEETSLVILDSSKPSFLFQVI